MQVLFIFFHPKKGWYLNVPAQNPDVSTNGKTHEIIANSSFERYDWMLRQVYLIYDFQKDDTRYVSLGKNSIFAQL